MPVMSGLQMCASWLQQSFVLCSPLCLITPVFVIRRENEHWKTKKRWDNQMQVRRPDPVLWGTDFWQKGVYRLQMNSEKNR